MSPSLNTVVNAFLIHVSPYLCETVVHGGDMTGHRGAFGDIAPGKCPFQPPGHVFDIAQVIDHGQRLWL